jgi:hypothetical protein
VVQYLSFISLIVCHTELLTETMPSFLSSVSPEFVAIVATVLCLATALGMIFVWNRNLKELITKTEHAKDILSPASMDNDDDYYEDETSRKQSKSNKPKKKRSRKKNNWGEMARGFLEKGDLDSALDALNKGITADSQDFACLYLRCNVNFKKFETLATDSASLDAAGQFLLKSLQDADACIKVDSTHEDGYLCKISILLYIDELSEALKTCRHGLRNIPNSKALKSCKSRVNKAMSPSGQLERMAKQKRAEEQKEQRQACGHDHVHSASCSTPAGASSAVVKDTSTTSEEGQRPSSRDHSHDHDHAHAHSEHCSHGTSADTILPSASKQVDSCAVCGSLQGLKACGRCKKVFYCGVECQKKDLKGHKEFCKANAQ